MEDTNLKTSVKSLGLFVAEKEISRAAKSDKTVHDSVSRQMIGAYDWASGQSSDPFALARARTHVRMGLCKPLANGTDGGYARNQRP